MRDEMYRGTSFVRCIYTHKVINVGPLYVCIVNDLFWTMSSSFAIIHDLHD